MNAQQRRKQKREKDFKSSAVKQFQRTCKHNGGRITNTEGPSKCALCGKAIGL